MFRDAYSVFTYLTSIMDKEFLPQRTQRKALKNSADSASYYPAGCSQNLMFFGSTGLIHYSRYLHSSQ